MSSLPGSSVPFVLMPVEGEEEGAFKLLGECYVHGIMDGKSWKEGEGLKRGEKFKPSEFERITII